MAEEEIFHEIEEDLRRQKLDAFWRENRAWILGSAILAVVFTGALVAWREWRLERNMAETAQLITAMDTADAAKISAFAAGADAAHAMLAKFAEAELFIARGEKDKAAAAYDAAAAGFSALDALPLVGADASWRDLAKLYGAAQRLDTGDAAQLHKTLDGLAGGPWRWSALELSAMLYAREGDAAKAAETLSSIAASAEAPPDIRQRASSLREVYLGRSGKAPSGGNG